MRPRIPSAGCSPRENRAEGESAETGISREFPTGCRRRNQPDPPFPGIVPGPQDPVCASPPAGGGRLRPVFRPSTIARSGKTIGWARWPRPIAWGGHIRRTRRPITTLRQGTRRLSSDDSEQNVPLDPTLDAFPRRRFFPPAIRVQFRGPQDLWRGQPSWVFDFPPCVTDLGGGSRYSGKLG